MSTGCSSTPASVGADAGAGSDANTGPYSDAANGPSSDANVGPSSDAGFATVLYPGMSGNVRAIPVPCGSLDPATASQLVLTRIDEVLLPAAEALAMIDNSTTLARFFATPQPSAITFASDTKTAVNNLADDLSEQWLIPANVESADGGQVTYLVQSSSSDGGLEAGSLNGFGSTDSSVRMTVSRIDCAAGDTVEVAVLIGSDQVRILAFELQNDHVYGRFFLGDMVNEGKQITESSCSAGTDVGPSDSGTTSSCTTTVSTVFDPAATGVIAAEVDVADAGPVHAVVAVAEPVSIGWSAPDGGTPQSVDLASTAESAGVAVDPNAGTISGSLGLGGMTVMTTVAAFVEAFFDGRSLVASADPDDPVNLSAAGLSGDFAYAAGTDEVQFIGMSLGDQPVTATHGADALMEVDFGPGAGVGVSTGITSAAATGVDLSFVSSSPLFSIHYDLASIAGEVVDLPPYAQGDVLSVSFGGQTPSLATLLPVQSSSSPPELAIFGGGARSLLQIQSGQLDVTSSFAPAEDIHVTGSQCLVESGDQSDTNDGLVGLSAAACQ